jgi:ankyrin repeat protein
VRESPIHWLIAFDDEQILAASKILAGICDSSDLQDPDISWNHPSIDLPGRFPLGSPLHFAAYFNNPTCMEALLEDFSIPINFTGSSEINALEFAVSRRRVDTADLLIAKGALSNLSISSLVLSEIGMQLPHETMAVTGTTQISPATLTARCLGAVIAQRPELLDGDAGEDWTPLMGAVQLHDRETVKALIDRGCDVNRATPEALERKTALHLITEKKLQYQEDDILNLLWQAGADFSARTLVGGKLVLHFAARDDCSSIAAQLLDEPHYCTDINATTLSYGETALHITAFNGSYSVAQLLLERGANTEIGHVKGTYHERDWDRLTPLAVAASRFRNGMVKLLLDSGASPFARPSSNHTVFHLAVTERDCRMLKMLLEIPNLVSDDVDVLNMSAVNGMTALHLCAGNLGRHEHLTLLLDAGADVNVLTHTGHSALDIACQTRDILQRLLRDSDIESEKLDEKEEDEATELYFWESIPCAQLYNKNRRCYSIPYQDFSSGR